MAEANWSNTMDFSDAPEGSLDDIFASVNDGVTQTETPVVPVTTTPEQTLEEAQPFLKTSTGTVYKSVDDAVKGIEHKDAYITQLKAELEAAKGPKPTVAETQSDAPKSYRSNPTEYFNRIKAAKDETELLKVQTEFVNEVTNDAIAPYAPILVGMVKSQAIDSVQSEIPKFREFLGSDDYKTTLDSFPLLKQSIEISETYPERSGDLAQLYRLAYNTAVGKNLPKYVAQGTGTPTPVQTRPTVTSTPAAPLPRTTTAPPSFGTSEGRKAIIEQQEANGVGNLRF
jgi:hypothetical protein